MAVPRRDDQCPKRGPGLRHHAEYPSYICSDCNVQCLIEGIRLDDDTVFFIAEKPCTLDHSDMTSGHNGKSWFACIQCGVLVEQKQNMTGPAGPPWGKGREGSFRAQYDAQLTWEYLSWFHGRTRGVMDP